jgi:hypothetical protein
VNKWKIKNYKLLLNLLQQNKIKLYKILYLLDINFLEIEKKNVFLIISNKYFP